jgi:hypothetical protein
MAPSTLSPDRELFRTIVAEIAEKAKATLPEANGRVDKAVAIVLNGDVELLPDGTAKVYSQSNGVQSYRVVDGTCDCMDFAQAPSSWCKHRIAHGIQTRAAARMPQPEVRTTTQHQPPPAAPLPEAPVSITLKATLHGHEVLVTLRGTDFANVQTQVEEASAWLHSQAPAPRTDDTPQCPTHGALKRSTKGKGWYCPHKLADGSWCKAKAQD